MYTNFTFIFVFILFEHCLSYVLCLSYQSLMFQYAASDSEILDDSGTGSHGKLSPRTSISAAEDDPPSGTNTPRRRFSKFNIGMCKFCS